MNINVSIEINDTKEKVWATITDFNNCQNMITAIKALKVIHQPEEGLIGFKWQETREVFGKESTETMWITDYAEQAFYQTRAENCGAIYVSKLEISDLASNNADKPKVLLTMSFSGTSDSWFVRLISKIMGVFIKKTMIKMLNNDLEDIKNFIENN